MRVLEVQGGDVTAQQEQDTTSGHLEIRGQHEVRDAPRIQRIHGMPDELGERGIYPGDAQVRRNQQHPASGGIEGDAEHLDITGLRVSRLRLALQLDVGRRQLLAALLQRLVEGADLLVDPALQREDAARGLQRGLPHAVCRVLAAHGSPSAYAAISVPMTRARILAKAVERLVERSSLNGANPQSSVVPSWSRGDETGRLQHPVADLLGCLDAGTEGVDDADEDALAGAHALADESEHSLAIWLMGQLDKEGTGRELKQARQQFGINDVGTVGRVSVPARTCWRRSGSAAQRRRGLAVTDHHMRIGWPASRWRGQGERPNSLQPSAGWPSDCWLCCSSIRCYTLGSIVERQPCPQRKERCFRRCCQRLPILAFSLFNRSQNDPVSRSI